MSPLEKISIPDDDAQGWIQTLREGGFSDEEIDSIMVGLNKTYKKLKKPELIKKQLEKDIATAEKEGVFYSDQEKESLRKLIESDFDE